MTVRDLQQTYLSPVSPYPVAAGDFFVLLSHTTGKDRSFLLAHPEYSLADHTRSRFISYLKRRALHEPVAYIIGHKEFYGRRFAVSPHVLIPRPETELLIEEVLKETQELASGQKISIIDVGTGSGAIIITLAKELKKKNISYYAIDISKNALHQAQENAEALAAKNISFLESNLLAEYWKENRRADHLMIAANLPYLSEEMHRNTERDVRDYEPALALVSGNDGIDHYRALITELSAHPRPAFTLFFEIDPAQKEPLCTLLAGAWPSGKTKIMADLSGKDRLIVFQNE